MKNHKVLTLWFCHFGGDKRDRTADLLNAIQALSQLSYTPIFCRVAHDFCIIAQLSKKSSIFFGFFLFVVGVTMMCDR
jgi:hypothetical protein